MSSSDATEIVDKLTGLSVEENQHVESEVAEVVEEAGTESGAPESSESEVVDAESGEEIVKDLALALEAKSSGNAQFIAKNYEEAADLYSDAIEMCPDENKNELAIFLGNRAACCYAQGHFDDSLEDCNESLLLNPIYTKVLMRRCQTFEKLTKLEESIADAKKIEELEPTFPNITRTIARLEKEQAEQLEKLKTEAFGKLKDLGNSILGNFGMSVDDFNMKQDPNTGSWNLSMGQQGGSSSNA